MIKSFPVFQKHPDVSIKIILFAALCLLYLLYSLKTALPWPEGDGTVFHARARDLLNGFFIDPDRLDIWFGPGYPLLVALLMFHPPNVQAQCFRGEVRAKMLDTDGSPYSEAGRPNPLKTAPKKPDSAYIIPRFRKYASPCAHQNIGGTGACGPT